MPGKFHVDAGYAELFREIGLNEETIFTDPRIQVWRSLPDRENAKLDYQGTRNTRLHIKRYPPPFSFMAEQELEGFNLLKKAGVPAAPIIAHGFRPDRSSFIILEDLAGYTPADKLLEKGFDFDRLLNTTADLTALLHNKRLHHRDLYLCHFMIKPEADPVDAKLIDMARVNRLNSVLRRRRWIIKDLAQFWYSMSSLPISHEQRERWLERYCQQRDIRFHRLIGPVEAKAAKIGKHDVELRKKQPGRNVSIQAPD